jgi:hypothetical protein
MTTGKGQAPGQCTAIGRSLTRPARRGSSIDLLSCGKSLARCYREAADEKHTLVFVDCQLAQEEGKMKGSTKSQKMDEPFNM